MHRQRYHVTAAADLRYNLPGLALLQAQHHRHGCIRPAGRAAAGGIACATLWACTGLDDDDTASEASWDDEAWNEPDA